jgi:hypothetical protein
VRADQRAIAFDTLLRQLSNQPSGDDDCFDYWPSGVRLAAELAPTPEDLQTLHVHILDVIDESGEDWPEWEELLEELEELVWR